jgi:hypothetical protein
MPKPIILVAGAVVAVAVVGGVVFTVTKKDKDTSANSNGSSSQSSDVAVVDPDGTYKYFSDPSITKAPEKNAKFGNGQTISVEYDGSKSPDEDGDILSYQLYYVQEDGKVQPMGGGTMEGKTSGTFSTSDMVFNSSANGRPGFIEITTVTDSGLSDSGQITGKNVVLGMYPITFEVAE